LLSSYCNFLYNSIRINIAPKKVFDILARIICDNQCDICEFKVIEKNNLSIFLDIFQKVSRSIGISESALFLSRLVGHFTPKLSDLMKSIGLECQPIIEKVLQSWYI
jgi:hypothetical protein